MIEKSFYPQIREIWHLYKPEESWRTCLIVESKNNGESFVTAKVIVTELPEDYNGINIEINDSFTTNVATPFTIFMDDLKEWKKEWFDVRRGQLSDEDWQKVLDIYSMLNK